MSAPDEKGPVPSAWLVLYRLENGRVVSSAWDNVADARSVEQMKREDGFADVQRIDCYTLDAAEALIRERVAEEMEDWADTRDAGDPEMTGNVGESYMLRWAAAFVREGSR